MPIFDVVTVDQVILAILSTAALREMLPTLLPASVAGPHGWLLHIEDDDK
ncbi:MAG: hypothetical protein KDK53_17660 [Maritimibacter sp.]|nr:hypothetical protein [Maritimibacter sp.]